MAEIDPAKVWRSNSSDNSSEISLDALLIEKVLVNNSLKFSALHKVKIKSFFRNLYISWYKSGDILKNVDLNGKLISEPKNLINVRSEKKNNNDNKSISDSYYEVGCKIFEINKIIN